MPVSALSSTVQVKTPSVLVSAYALTLNWAGSARLHMRSFATPVPSPSNDVQAFAASVSLCAALPMLTGSGGLSWEQPPSVKISAVITAPTLLGALMVQPSRVAVRHRHTSSSCRKYPTDFPTGRT